MHLGTRLALAVSVNTIIQSSSWFQVAHIQVKYASEIFTVGWKGDLLERMEQ